MSEMENYSAADVEATAAAFAAAAQANIDRLIAETVADGRKMVTVRVITSIDDIPGADVIKVAQVEGWQVVVKAGEFQAGDLCVFFEVDSFLQLSDERFKFLEKNRTTWQGVEGVRLKTIRLRKQLSQGLALPVALFPELKAMVESLSREELREVNFTGPIGVMKWEKVMSAQLRGMAKGDFPSFLRKSDQERCQNMAGQIFGYDEQTSPVPQVAIDAMSLTALTEAIEAGRMRMINDVIHFIRPAQASRDTRYEVTLKMDGSSMTVYNFNDKQGVCSRNLELKIEGNEDNSFVKMATAGMLETLGILGRNIAVQGELMGPGIQGNREGFTNNQFFVYNILDIDKGEFLPPQERLDLIRELNDVGEDIDHFFQKVPQLHYNVTLEELGLTDMASLLKFAEGPSMVNKVREGVVFKAMDGSHQFKAISNKYLEEEK